MGLACQKESLRYVPYDSSANYLVIRSPAACCGHINRYNDAEPIIIITMYYHYDGGHMKILQGYHIIFH